MSILLFIFQAFLYPIIYIFPAYAANGAPVIFGGGAPIDRKAKLRGRRVFGNNKTIRGAVAGIVAGSAVGLIEYPFLHFMLPIAVLLAVGAISGDLVGSFIKRQLGVRPGNGFPIMDQYGFFIVALLFAFSLGHMPSLYGMLFLIVLTGLLHVATNRGAYALHLKSVPW